MLYLLNEVLKENENTENTEERSDARILNLLPDSITEIRIQLLCIFCLITLLWIFNLLQSIHYGNEIRLLAAPPRHLLAWNWDFWPLHTLRLQRSCLGGLAVLFQSIELHLALGHPAVLWGALQESANNTLKFMNHFEIYEPYCLFAE